MASKARKIKAHQAKIFNTIENNTILLDLLETSISSAWKTIFIEALIRSLPTAFDHFGEPHLLFDIFTTWFGNHSQSSLQFSRIDAALQYRQQYFLETHFKKWQYISKIGLDWTSDDKDTSFQSKVNFFLCWFWKVLINFLDQDNLCFKVENTLSSHIQMDCRIRNHWRSLATSYWTRSSTR